MGAKERGRVKGACGIKKSKLCKLLYAARNEEPSEAHEMHSMPHALERPAARHIH